MIRVVETKVRVLRDGAQYTELQYAPGSAPRIRCRDDAKIKMSMTGQFRPNPLVNWLSDELQAVLVIDGVEHPVGVFLPASVEEVEENGMRTLRVEAYDRCWRIQTQYYGLKTEYQAGASYLATVESILTSAGIGNVLATASSATISTGRVWIGDTDKLAQANELLQEINYKELWFTAEGVAVLEPYVEPNVDNIQHTLDGDSIKSLLLPQISRKTDIYDAPNVFVCICASPNNASVMYARATNNSPSSPFSVIRRGRQIFKIIQVKNIASQAELQAYADRLRNESMLRGETIQVETALLPGYGVADVVALHYGDLAALCLDRSWTMDFQPGGTMTHTLERVVANYE